MMSSQLEYIQNSGLRRLSLRSVRKLDISAVIQGLAEICLQIRERLHAHAQPDKLISEAKFLAPLHRHTRVRHHSRMIDEALHSTQRFGQREQLRPFTEALRRLEPALQANRNNPAKPIHLPL